VRSLISKSFAGVLCLMFSMQPLTAQQAEPVGAVSNASNATVGTTPVSSGTTLFSGDLVKTGEAGRLQVQSGTTQFVFDSNSAARIFRAGDRVTVELERGSVSYSARGVSDSLTLFAQDIKFVPRSGELAVGTIAIVTRCEVKASTVGGTLQATSGKESKTIDPNGSYNVLSEIGVEYNDSWKPVPQEYPEYPRGAEYHHSHKHVACAEGVWQTKRGPILAGTEGHFKIVMAGAVGIATTVVLIKALESPAKP